MYTITYSLVGDGVNSDSFYQDTAIFTDELLFELDCLTCKFVTGYTAYLRAEGKEACSQEECGFELLVLGVLWQTYSGDAMGLDETPQQLLSQLAKLREQGSRLKPGIDFLRGILATIYLSPDLYDNLFVLDANLANLAKLMDWLEATGEFKRAA